MDATISLRSLAIDDARIMATVLGDPSLYKFTGGEPPSVAELERRYATQIRGCSADGAERWINLLVVLEPAGEPIGYVQATVPRTGPAEIAWVIGRPWQGNGYAGRAAEMLVTVLKERGERDLVAHIHPDHAASQSVARRLGMVPTEVVVDGEIRWVGWV